MVVLTLDPRRASFFAGLARGDFGQSRVYLPSRNPYLSPPTPPQMPRNSADISTRNARASFHRASTDTALVPRSTWLM